MPGTLTRGEPFTEPADRLVVRADRPGSKPEEIGIQVEDDTLTVFGEHRESAVTIPLQREAPKEPVRTTPASA